MANETKTRKESQSGGSEGESLGRREFFLRLGLGSLGIASAGTAAFSYQFLSPNVLYEPSPVVNMGKPESYGLDSVTLNVDARVFVIHSQEGFFALNAVCTHLGCLTAWKPEQNMIACPCHGSKFTREGVKTDGPAPRPLPWLRMWLTEDGDLMVDRATDIRPLQFVRV
jgi:cytochrome b6-f complex iron-sulfur subunit